MHLRRSWIGLLPGALLLAGGGPSGSATAGPGVASGPDGAASAESVNRLAHESSPYLRLHATNPVDWYPWGAEALERARTEDKPIFLSIGYSTCYWCHVMEREVFSDPEIAELMNRWFVNVKVDREERPDLDEIYMTATQLLTRHGGWPNSVFLTPDLEPFYAGTYFPPEDREGRPGFPTILRALHGAWTERRSQVEATAERVVAALGEAIDAGGEPADRVPGGAAAEAAAERLAESYDEEWGGFGEAPKFPSPASLRLLWQRGERGDAEARRMVLETLRKMGRGAIYDHLDGGFHRYTLDRAWRVPHFEKMLYDNAQLGELLGAAAVASADAELERLARGTLDFVLEWLRLDNGAFKSAIDAETDAVEGAYYIWTREEAERVLGEEGFRLLGPIFGLDGEPNIESDHYTLYLTRPLAEHARRLGLERRELLERMEPHLDALRRARRLRPLPLVDDKVLCDWNGMMVAALARAGRELSEPRYLAAAERAAGFLLTMRDGEGEQLHAWRQGEARIPAFLEDYAFLVDGLLALHESTGAGRWLREAVRLGDEMERRLRAPAGGYYMSAARPDLLFRVVSAADGAVPSGNGAAVLAQIELAARTGRRDFAERAAAALRAFAGDLERYPRAVPTLALAAERWGELAAPAAAGADEVPAVGGTSPVVGAPTSPMARLAREVVTVRAREAGPAGSDGARPIAVSLEIRAGWHVNANPASLELLIPTTIGGEVRDVRYPPGESFRFDFVPEEILVWSGAARIDAVALGDEVELTYQPCDDSRCLAPVTETLPIARAEPGH